MKTCNLIKNLKLCCLFLSIFVGETMANESPMTQKRCGATTAGNFALTFHNGSFGARLTFLDSRDSLLIVHQAGKKMIKRERVREILYRQIDESSGELVLEFKQGADLSVGLIRLECWDDLSDVYSGKYQFVKIK